MRAPPRPTRNRFQKSVDMYGHAKDILANYVPSPFSYYNLNCYLVKPYVIGPKRRSHRLSDARVGR